MKERERKRRKAERVREFLAFSWYGVCERKLGGVRERERERERKIGNESCVR